jgi:glycosyltransferase involved in cell wall biosynthesis
MVKFSIIVIVKNGIKYVLETINSILQQTYDNYEIIIIDGGSTDGTIDLIQNIKTSKIYFESRVDKGPSYALNYASQFVEGDYVLHLHSDDTLKNENILKEINDIIIQNKYPFWLTGFYDFVNSKGNVIRTDNVNSNISYDRMLIGNIIRHQSTFFKSCYLKNNLFRHDCGTAFDYYFFLNMFYMHGNPLIIRKHLVKFRLDGNNLSSDFIKSLNSEKIARKLWRQNTMSKFKVINFAIQIKDLFIYIVRYLKLILVHNKIKNKF